MLAQTLDDGKTPSLLRCMLYLDILCNFHMFETDTYGSLFVFSFLINH